MEQGAISGKTLIILELTISAVVCLGFGFYQLWSLKRDKAITRAKKQAEANLQNQQNG